MQLQKNNKIIFFHFLEKYNPRKVEWPFSEAILILLVNENGLTKGPFSFFGKLRMASLSGHSHFLVQ